MAEPINVNRLLVQGGVLRVTPDGGESTDYPIGGFNILFALDTIPTAQVTLSMGRSVRTRDVLSVQGISERDAADILFTIQGTERLLLSGYVSGITTDNSTTGNNTQFTTSVTIKHRAVKLAGAPSTSFIYTGKSNQSLDTLHSLKLRASIFEPDPQAPSNGTLYSITAFIQKLNAAVGPDAAYFPSLVLKTVLAGLYKEFNDAQLDAAHVTISMTR